MAGGPVSPVKAPTLTGSPGARVAAYAHNAGFSGEALVTAVAISKAESGWDATAKGGPNSNGTYDWGLWQINDVHKPSNAVKTQPLANAREAFRIYKAANGFGPWATFGSGAYKAHLPAARAAVAELKKLGPEWERETVAAQKISDSRGINPDQPDGLTSIKNSLPDVPGAIAGGINALSEQFGKVAGNAFGIAIAIVLLAVGILILARGAAIGGAASVVKKALP